MNMLMCKNLTPQKVEIECGGTPTTTPGVALKFFRDQAKCFSEGAQCTTGKCVGYWRDRKNENGSTPGMRKYSAELFFACKM